ncbi:hypothetical protein D9619_003611 [Psilocybe cf. subviscida]|uniref:MYND-type domain-containing protein n=1 Tax=Psilocybe cf. subviscida TaxID=2480587 RepID=A0A8H5AXP2_9AGAR|nr:hypothetical protein D9619_003611 [Psilocybe cf. subviscida]
MPVSPEYEAKVLELYDVALLLNYERGTTEPRFRHTKLREIATPGTNFRTVKIMAPEWTEAAVPRTGLVFDRQKPPSDQTEEPDLSENILPEPVPHILQNLTPRDLETYYWQARNHDGCFSTVTLFQHFIDLLQDEYIRIRVRTVDGKNTRVYTTLASDRLIVEMELFEPKHLTASIVIPDNQTYITGADARSLHAVLGFASPGAKLDTILDLSALQFGSDAGRGGPKNHDLFVLEPIARYDARLLKFATGNTFREAKLSGRIRDNAPNNAWLLEVAQRAKDRWDNRENVPWCGHCGAPPRGGQDLKKCSKCKNAYYCNAEHQAWAWPFHKHFCDETK